MSKKFLIAGSIVDTLADKWTPEDVTPIEIDEFIKGLSDSEEIELEITSFGGSVTAGLAICNMLKKASAEGHKTTAHVIGLAASMASVIACACDELKMDSNAMMMIHNPWTVTMGNANDMRKEADTLDTFRDALLSIYRTKFDTTDGVIKQMMDDETWILGEQAEMFALKAEVIPTEELKIAASLKTPKFFATLKHLPQRIKNIMENKDNEKIDAPVDTAQDVNENVKPEEQPKEEPNEEPKVEEPVEQPKAEEQQQTSEVEDTPVEEEETVTKAECERRVSGMQSTMAKKLDALKKEYEAKIEDFTNQLKGKDEELVKAKAEITRLETDLDSTKKLNAELSDAKVEAEQRTSALEAELVEKSDALAKLNAAVNTPSESVNWKALKGKAFFDYVKKHPEVTKK